MPCRSRRQLLRFVAASLLPSLAWAQAAADADPAAAAWQALAQDGSIVLFRHAEAPGTGDPPGFRLGDCSTQRNLSETGRRQAREIGARFRERRIAVGAVVSSQWCRTRETAELAFPGRVREEPAFNSFFGDAAAREDAQTAAARALLTRWRGPGVLVVTTHQVNITALTGVYPASGEGVVLRPDGQSLAVVGRLAPGR
jgi:phosphohistidine phosphatase SixA